MGSAVIDETFGDFLVESGLERMSSSGIYRGTHRSDSIPNGQNVFVSLADTDDLSLMCPIGQADEIDTDDVDASRDPGDGCSVTMAGSFLGLVRSLDVNDFITQPGNIIERAIDLAEYTEVVRSRLDGARAVRLAHGAGDSSAHIASGGNIWGTSVNVVGTFEADGGIWDTMLNKLGAVDAGGEIWTTLPSRVGSVDNQGQIWNENLQIIGSVDFDGTIWNTALQVVGSVDRPATLQQAGAAAVLLGLIP